MRNLKSLIAEAFGTFWLVFGGCGAAIFSAAFPDLGIGFLGVALAFGLTVVTMVYAVGHVSGGHFNPAVTVGMWAGGRFEGARVVPYIVVQLIGAVLAAAALYCIASGKPGFEMMPGALASNGVGEHSPGGYSLASGLMAEALLTGFFLFVIMGTTHDNAPVGFAPLAIGLTLTLIHLIAIPITNTSVNPARSTGPALLEGGIALQQLWVFWLAPIVGGSIGAWLFRTLIEKE
jgi:aquaporin Z